MKHTSEMNEMNGLCVMIIFDNINIKQTQSNKKSFFFHSTNNICQTLTFETTVDEKNLYMCTWEKDGNNRKKEEITKRGENIFFFVVELCSPADTQNLLEI